MRWRLLLGVLAVFVLATGAAATENSNVIQNIPVKATETKLGVQAQSSQELRFHVDIGELAAFELQTKGGTFTRLLIPGFHSSQREGAPELPMMNRLIAIPYGATARVEVEAVQSRMINLADFGIDTPLMPAQPSMPKSADPETWPFSYDRSAYEVDVVSQELVTIVEQGRLRAMDLGRVEVSPVEYFPRTNQIRVTDSIDFRVIFEGADRAAGQDLMAKTASPFYWPLYAKVANAKAFQDDYPDRVQDVVTMVVITPPEFEFQLQDYVDWKTERGFHLIVGVIGSPEVGGTTTSIQSYIHGLYNSPAPGIPAPSFVLFVGDVAECPTFFEGGDATDRPYCAVDGDIVPDIYYGRFSATNSSQLQAILDKTLMYDQFTMPDPSYLGEVCMIAGVDSYWAPTHANGQINYGTDHYFNLAHGITSHTYLYPVSGSSGPQIIQDVSDGVAFVNYTAHGSATSWADPSFTQSDVNGLANYGEYCTAVGNCCTTSEYDYGECFGETWLRAVDKGAIAYIGGSNSTYWDEDFWWGVGYTASITANPTYAATGLGAYDGLFHDHGELEHLWYVTNDAIIFSGNLAVMESGSSRITYYWNIYNLLGDPSISTYLGVPTANAVGHPSTVFTTWTSLTVGAEHGSYVGLTQAGVLVGAGTVGETGSLTVDFLTTPLTPGVPLHLVVMAQNREPYVVDLDVIVPATVIIDPMVIDANVATDITVTVLDAEGINPQPGIDIWAEGLGYSTTPVATGPDGVAVITVNYPYGPTLDIVGKDPAESYRLFTEQITVNASPLTTPDLYVTTDIGLSDAFALNLPGTLHAVVTEPGHTLYGVLPDGTELSTTDVSLTLTPNELGQVTGIIAVSGYDVYSEAFDIIEAYGTLTGTVASGGSPLSGVTVRGYDAGMALAFEAVTNGSGQYDMVDDILVADYTLMVDHFGYLHYEDSYFLNYGANVHDIDLAAAPSGVLTGTVTEVGTGAPLAASVKVYRTDTGELYTETTSSGVDGTYTTTALPYFDYQVTVKAWHYIPVTIDLTVEDALVEKHFVLEPTIGDLLVIDATAKQSLAPPKYAADGTLLADGYELASGKAVADIVTDLEDLGYTVTQETATGSDPATWVNYDLLLVSAGDYTSDLSSTLTSNLISFVNDGGHLLIEGGEVGYNHYGDSFGAQVLHTNDWNADESGNITVADPAHYVMSVPNTITGPVTMTYSGYGDHDAMVPTGGAVMVGSWTDQPAEASIICYDPNPAPEGGQIVYYCFNYSAMDAAVRPDLLQNSVTWLMTPEVGNCAVSGTATLPGTTDHSGILVQALPGGGSVTTGPTGEFTLTGLFAGTYTIRASKMSYTPASTDVTLTDGQHLTGVTLELGTATGSLLVIDDSSKGGLNPAKHALKGDAVLAEAYTAPAGKAAADMVADLESLGYSVVTETVAGTDPSSWSAYDLLLVSCGDNISPVADANFRSELEAYAGACGKLLIEGGEVGYDAGSYPGYPSFAGAVLHITGWNHDSSGDVTVADPTHPVMSTPNVITGPITVGYSGYGDQDAVTVATGAQMIGSWTSYPGDASIITFDHTPSPVGGNNVYLAFNYSAMDAATRADLLHNAVSWLTNSEGPGTSSIAGTCYVDGAPDNSGVLVEANPGGFSDVTGPDGSYHLIDMYAGTYTVTVTLIGYGAAPQIVTLGDNDHVTGIDFGLGRVTEHVFCDDVVTAIPDNDPAGITKSILCTEEGLLNDVYCSVDITHTFIGDLIVELTSPDGTIVRLHNRTGASTDDLHANYDLDTNPDGPGAMSDFDGENPLGEWTLFVSDNAGIDTGSVDQWCLDLFIAEEVISAVAGAIEVVTTEGGLNLSWPYDAQELDGFNIYRRLAGEEPIRLTDLPVAGRDGRIDYTDPGYGIANGTVLFYSYGMVQDGEEIGRSAEVEVVFTGVVPTMFALHGNFPNPFNPLTTIKFDLPRAGRVTLSIYDLSGKLVKNLVNGALPAARHLFRWDGTDGSGRRVASGVYYYRLITPQERATRSMLMVK